MAWNSEPRERSFDFEKKRFAANTRLFAGPSSASDSTNYPGDDKIVEGDSITIQLHHIKFKGIELILWLLIIPKILRQTTALMNRKIRKTME